MSKALKELIEKGQQKLQSRDHQMRWLWIALITFALIALAFTWLREDPATAPVNINTATIETLCYLPEVGPELAQRIIASRPFTQPEDFLKVKPEVQSSRCRRRCQAWQHKTSGIAAAVSNRYCPRSPGDLCGQCW